MINHKVLCSLRKQLFLLALRRWGRFASVEEGGETAVLAGWVFCTLKHHNPTFEKKYNFLELFSVLFFYIEFYFNELNFKDNFSPKLRGEWMNESKYGSRELPPASRLR